MGKKTLNFVPDTRKTPVKKTMLYWLAKKIIRGDEDLYEYLYEVDKLQAIADDAGHDADTTELNGAFPHCVSFLKGLKEVSGEQPKAIKMRNKLNEISDAVAQLEEENFSENCAPEQKTILSKKIKEAADSVSAPAQQFFNESKDTKENFEEKVKAETLDAKKNSGDVGEKNYSDEERNQERIEVIMIDKGYLPKRPNLKR